MKNQFTSRRCCCISCLDIFEVLATTFSLSLSAEASVIRPAIDGSCFRGSQNEVFHKFINKFLPSHPYSKVPRRVNTIRQLQSQFPVHYLSTHTDKTLQIPPEIHLCNIISSTPTNLSIPQPNRDAGPTRKKKQDVCNEILFVRTKRATEDADTPDSDASVLLRVRAALFVLALLRIHHRHGAQWTCTSKLPAPVQLSTARGHHISCPRPQLLKRQDHRYSASEAGAHHQCQRMRASQW